MFQFLNKETNGLHQAAFLLASASVGAKILAVLRDRLLASSFGAGKVLDIYYASFRLPDLLYVFSLFLVSVTALIPIFLKKREQSRKGKNLINSVFSVFFASMILSVFVAFILMPFLTPLIAPGFSAEDNDTLVKFSRILLLSPLLLGLSNLVSSVIQSFRRFFAYALSGVLYNAGIIFGLLVLYPKFGLTGIVWGVVLGAALHFLIQVPSLIQLGYFPRLTLNISFFEIKQIIKLSFPRTLGLTLNQLVMVAITAMASFLTAGSIAVFNLASNLQSIPLGVVALSYSVAAFPSLAKNFIKKEKDKFLSSVISGFRHILFWLLPITILFIVLRAQIVRVVLGAGAFTWADTRLTAAALSLFAFSLFAQGLILLLVRAFYAAGKTKLPLMINIVSSFFIVIFSVVSLYLFENFVSLSSLFERFLRVEGVLGVSVLVLPLAFSLGSILNFILLFLFFEREFGKVGVVIKKSVLEILGASVLVGVVAYLSLVGFSFIFDLNTFLGVFAQGLLSGLFAIVVGFFLFKFLKNRELRELVFSLRKKFGKKMLIKSTLPLGGSEPEELP